MCRKSSKRLFPATHKNIIHLIFIKYSGDEDTHLNQNECESPGPADITEIPKTFETDSDDRVSQSEVMMEIVATADDACNTDKFNNMGVRKLKLSRLEQHYDDKDTRVVNALSNRHTIEIDEHFLLKPGSGQVNMRTDKTMLDYHLTVANSIGLASLLPAETNAPRFLFEMDLRKQYRDFKGKHAMIGFDTKGKMLYIGKCLNEDVFLSMAPNDFLSNNAELAPPGFTTGSPLMTRRHYRQIVMMFAFFLQRLTGGGFFNHKEVFDLDLDSTKPNWDLVTNILYVCEINPQHSHHHVIPQLTHINSIEGDIRLNFKDVKALDTEIVADYQAWVAAAPPHWKADGFLEKNSPIIITSRFGQNAAIAVLGNEEREAALWDLQHDYSKIAFLTFALATPIE